MGEDEAVGFDLINGAAVQPLGEEAAAFAAAPAGVGGGFDAVHLLLGPARFQEALEEAVVAHFRHGGVVPGDDQDRIAGLQAVFHEALGAFQADAFIVALDHGYGVVGHGVDDPVEHHKGDVAVHQLFHGGFQGVVIGQDHDGLGRLVVDDVLHLGNLVGGIGRGDDPGGVGAGIVDFLGFFFSIGQHGASPAVVGVGHEDDDVLIGGQHAGHRHQHHNGQQQG